MPCSTSSELANASIAAGRPQRDLVPQHALRTLCLHCSNASHASGSKKPFSHLFPVYLMRILRSILFIVERKIADYLSERMDESGPKGHQINGTKKHNSLKEIENGFSSSAAFPLPPHRVKPTNRTTKAARVHFVAITPACLKPPTHKNTHSKAAFTNPMAVALRIAHAHRCPDTTQHTRLVDAIAPLIPQ